MIPTGVCKEIPQVSGVVPDRKDKIRARARGSSERGNPSHLSLTIPDFEVPASEKPIEEEKIFKRQRMLRKVPSFP